LAKPPATFSGAVQTLDGRLPSAPIMKSDSVPRHPLGLLCGSYIWSAGSPQPSRGLLIDANVASHASQSLMSRWPSTAFCWLGAQPGELCQ